MSPHSQELDSLVPDSHCVAVQQTYRNVITRFCSLVSMLGDMYSVTSHVFNGWQLCR